MNRSMIAVAVMVASIGLGLAPTASAGPSYDTCTEAAEDGVFNIPEDSDDYWSGGDRDGDGIACESSG